MKKAFRSFLFIFLLPTGILAQNNNEKLKEAIVVLGFDDAEISHYMIVAPLLKGYGFGATFFVCEMPWKSPGDSIYYMK